MSKKSKLTPTHYIGGAVALALGVYAYKNRGQLRSKVATLLGKAPMVAAAKPAAALPAPKATVSVAAVAAKAKAKK